MTELTEVMRYKWDEKFVNILNNIRIAKCSEGYVKQAQMRKIPMENVYPDATLLFAEISPKDDYNANKIGQLNHLEIKIECMDVFPSNIDLADRLINGQFGVVFDFSYIGSSITKVYIKLDDQNADKNAIRKTCMPQSIKLC